MTQPQHTPTPWTTDYDGMLYGANGARLLTSGVEYLGETENPWAAIKEDGDAAFIVRAVNAHDDLVLALTNLYEMKVTNDDDVRAVMNQASAALKLAKGGVS